MICQFNAKKESCDFTSAEKVKSKEYLKIIIVLKWMCRSMKLNCYSFWYRLLIIDYKQMKNESYHSKKQTDKIKELNKNDRK
jgi:hypothetical protein